MRKTLFIFGVIAAALVLAGAGCAKKGAITPAPEGTGAPTGGSPAAEETVPATKDGDIGILTDELYIEIEAQDVYHIGSDDLYPNWVSGGREKFFKSKGVTEDQIVAYAEKILNDPNPLRPSEIADKIGKRLEELKNQ